MFYTVVRIFYQGDSETHFVQHYTDWSTAQTYFYKYIAADLAKEDVTWQGCYIINSNGLMMESKVFDRRTTTGETEG